MLLLERNDYMFSFDLKSGYHHVDVAEAHQRFLDIEWGGAYYMFTVLPFGLSTACYVFTKLLRPLVRYWRARLVALELFYIWMTAWQSLLISIQHSQLVILFARPLAVQGLLPILLNRSGHLYRGCRG